jgi:hypothetical protein
MPNDNATAGLEQVSQDSQEATLKLAQSGVSADIISSYIWLSHQMVHQVIAMHRVTMVELIMLPTLSDCQCSAASCLKSLYSSS